MTKKGPLVSSLSVSFRKAVTVTEDVAEAKKEHRGNLKTLVDKYMQGIVEGKVEGIRNAKELVEVIKADLLLMGEATDRSETNGVDDMKVIKMQQALDENDPNVQSLLANMMRILNDSNDEEEDAPDIDTGVGADEGVEEPST